MAKTKEYNSFAYLCIKGLISQSDARPTGDQEVAGPNPTGSSIFCSRSVPTVVLRGTFTVFEVNKVAQLNQHSKNIRWSYNVCFTWSPPVYITVYSVFNNLIQIILSWRLILKYFLPSFSPYRWFRMLRSSIVSLQMYSPTLRIVRSLY